MNDDIVWKTKLAARIHDPAEKALVLLRDPAGHESGTSAALERLLGLGTLSENITSDNEVVLSSLLFKKGLPLEIYQHVQRADWWAAAADRPQWPMQEITVATKTGKKKSFAVAPWAQVRWTNQPVLIHPLTGDKFDLGKHGGLSDTDIHDIKSRSFDHFSSLLVKLGAQDEESRDLRKILLTFWRFGSELEEESDNNKLGALWKILPADTRIPDHSIWDHLDLTSAFAGAFSADIKGEAALLALSIGPVQNFIAAARKMDDLWAGSHLLSRLAWEAMKQVCERLGPDAILFPRLQGIPQVDLWLRDEMQLPDELFKDCDWMKGSTDSNPLFSAALPNRFVAVVPANEAKEIAEAVKNGVRNWLRELGNDVVSRLLKVSDFDVETTLKPYEQMREQLEGFPEVHWAAVPFSLINPKNSKGQTDLDIIALSDAMAPFFCGEDGKPCGFLDTPAWKVLQKEIDWGDNTTFFLPNPGALYPAIYDLAERVLAAAKATRNFHQTEQKGWRCSLSGETEWLTTDQNQLNTPPGSRKDTIWTRVAYKKPAWAKKGEHLGALPTIKRLWPTIFAEEVGKAMAAGERGERKSIGRFVVSTHTMALAQQIDKWLKNSAETVGEFDLGNADPMALPRKLMRDHQGLASLEKAKYIPGLLEAAREVNEAAYEKANLLVRNILNVDKLETYYALMMMDGDSMGPILSGNEKTAITYHESFHPQIQKGFDVHAERQPLIKQYGCQKRPISPNRHLAISGALNNFSQNIVRHVIEEEYFGRVIYAGGDDVLAMLPVADLFPAMQRLRQAYSGHDPEHKGGIDKDILNLHNGFAALMRNNKLQIMRMMGRNATASCGAVIAHHMAPLSAVMRELRSTEKRAKNEGGRDAFSISIIKRSGGSLHLTEKWGEPVILLAELRNFLANDLVSRRAVYNSLEWLHDLPDVKGKPEMLESLLAYQLSRQSGGDAKNLSSGLAKRLAIMAAAQTNNGLKWLENFMNVAEFLARETHRGNE